MESRVFCILWHRQSVTISRPKMPSLKWARPIWGHQVTKQSVQSFRPQPQALKTWENFLCLTRNDAGNCSWLRNNNSTTQPEKLDVSTMSANCIKHCFKMLGDEEKQRGGPGRHMPEEARGNMCGLRPQWISTLSEATDAWINADNSMWSGM